MSDAGHNELNEIKVQLRVLITAVEDMRGSISQVVAIDKNVSNIELKVGNIERWLRDLEHADKNTRQQIQVVDDKVTLKVDTVTASHAALVNKLEGATRLGKIAYTIFFAITLAFGDWLIGRAETNRSMILNQEKTHALLQKDVDFLMGVILSNPAYAERAR